MLCFLFAALIVALDQFFKHWILRTLEVGEVGSELIPGVIGLTRWENDGAMLNILSGQQWLLAIIALCATIVLIMILLRYNEGFWGTLGLAAVLGGTVGNLFDRVLNEGKVIDMFRTLFIDFPIFNIADIFITLGFLTFLIHFISLSFTAGKQETAAAEQEDDEYTEEQAESVYDEFPDIDAIVSAQAQQEVADSEDRYSPDQYTSDQYAPDQYASDQYAPDQYTSDQYAPDQYASDQEASDQYSQAPQYSPEPVMSSDYEPLTEASLDSSFSLDDLDLDLGSTEDYDINDLLREYGFEDDE